MAKAEASTSGQYLPEPLHVGLKVPNPCYITEKDSCWTQIASARIWFSQHRDDSAGQNNDVHLRKVHGKKNRNFHIKIFQAIKHDN
jgi:hypothetical protein